LAVEATTDGAQLARADLALRGEGDVLGKDQSGSRRRLRLLRLIEDEALIAAARDEAVAVVAADPELASAPALRSAVASWLSQDTAAFLDKV
jgi:ATP-dependent DNA helicase RecG